MTNEDLMRNVHIDAKENLRWCADRFSLEHLLPHAEACAKGECSSYSHCFFGKVMDSPFCAKVPRITCAMAILREKQPSFES